MACRFGGGAPSRQSILQVYEVPREGILQVYQEVAVTVARERFIILFS
jgi:hypothetical protein